jgi:nucleoid DNA-binding protein
MNKKELAKELSNRTLMNQKESLEMIEKVFDLISDKIQDGEEVSIVGFGKFYQYEHAPRPVRNPKTQESMILKPYKVLRFKSSAVIKKALRKQSENK